MFQTFSEVILYFVDSMLALGTSLLVIGLVAVALIVWALLHFVFRRGQTAK